ncbi:MAG: CBS domain-containing protein [Pseudomonadales bacterium]|nr:CBS domain-containing protein [Pseudomonadales bacterium]MBL4867039.1 CBS domain-containing protein [Pseudomonadales bacterium]
MNIGSYCNREVITSSADATVREVAQLMRQHHVGIIVIVQPTEDGNRPIGIVTDRDLVVELVAQDVPLESVTVTDLMMTDLITAEETDDLMGTISLMKRKGIRRIPVVSRENDLVGILAVDDVLELISEQMVNIVKLISREVEEEKNLHS